MEISAIARHHPLPSFSRAENHMGIAHVSGL